MSVPWQKILDLAVMLYRLFVSGKTFNLPGGDPVTFPFQSPDISGKLKEQLPATRQLLSLHSSQLSQTARGTSDPVASTLRWFLFAVVGAPVAALVLLGAVEWRTLTDDVPENHITATLRRVWQSSPKAFLGVTVVWVASVVGFVTWLLTHVLKG